MLSPARAPRRPLDGILLLDKPLGLTSNRALQDVRKLFRADKAGHTGSLDPLATGMLPVCFGEGTKLCGLLLDSAKRYTATARIGRTTTTGDAEGEVIRRSDPSNLQRADIEAVRSRFLGRISQVPPMYSALKVEGRRLYELARAGQEVERAPREVWIESLDLIEFESDRLVIDVRCSKGTYIRTLVEDLLDALGQCAHLSALRRTEVRPFESQTLWTMDALAALGPESLDRALLPLVSAVRQWPSTTLDAQSLRLMSRGQAVRSPAATGEVSEQGDIAILDAAGALKAIACRDREGRLAPRRWLGGAHQA
ncbi:MAG: tRNA pseudouridine(55) synthase TruB [Panacagrimonas sp.]